MEARMNLTLTLAVADLEATAEFYREVLQLPVEQLIPLPGHPPLLLLLRGDASLLFREKSTLEALHPAQFQHLDRHPLGLGMTLDFAVADLEPALRAIARRNLHTLYELEDAEHRRREIWLHDPDGYLIILSQDPTRS
jgi:catechol 2,3-dioxygenase-like lactoylglutathione lyase family enzyme